jgi:hypothetical protein
VIGRSRGRLNRSNKRATRLVSLLGDQQIRRSVRPATTIQTSAEASDESPSDCEGKAGDKSDGLYLWKKTDMVGIDIKPLALVIASSHHVDQSLGAMKPRSHWTETWRCCRGTKMALHESNRYTRDQPVPIHSCAHAHGSDVASQSSGHDEICVA